MLAMHQLKIGMLLLEVILTTDEHAFKQKWTRRHDSCNKPVKKGCTIPVLPYAQQQTPQIRHKKRTMEATNDGDHLGVTTDVLQWHRIEHQNEEGKTLSVAYQRNQLLHGQSTYRGVI